MKKRIFDILLIMMLVLFSSCATLPDNASNRTTIIVPDQFKTIQEAINFSQDGDIILIKKGTYKGNIDLSKAVSLIGVSPEETIIIPDENNNEFGIKISFSKYGSFGIRNTEYVNISSLQIRNFRIGIDCAYKNIGSIENCIIIDSNDLASWPLFLQGTNTPIRNCTIIGSIFLHECSSRIENNIIRFSPPENSYSPTGKAISISESPEMIIENNVIWGECDGHISPNNIFADPELKNIEDLQFESIYSADSYGAKIEGKFVEKEIDDDGPEFIILNNLNFDDLNIIEQRDLVLQIKVYDKSPIKNIVIESEIIDCLEEFKFERTGYVKELNRTLILQTGYSTINISSEDIFGNVTDQTLNFQLGSDTIPRSSWNGRNDINDFPERYSRKIGLAIGIQEYPEGLNTIKYAENDAIAMNNLLKKNGYETLPLLLNPTLYQLKTALIDLEKSEQEYDKVVIYISGHGANESTIFSDSYGLILPIDVELTNLSLTSFPMEDFRNFVNKLEAKTVIIILDMCFSAGGKGYGNLPKDANDNYITQILTDSGQGKILLASSGDIEQSFEDSELEHGVFTYYLIEAVEKGLISIDSIYDYIYAEIQNSGRWSQRPRKIFLSDDIEGFHTLF